MLTYRIIVKNARKDACNVKAKVLVLLVPMKNSKFKAFVLIIVLMRLIHQDHHAFHVLKDAFNALLILYV